MFKRVCLLLFIVIAVVPLSPTYACSGGRGYTMSEMVDEADIIVQGQMDMIDERGQNGVMKIETVFSTSDVPQFILLNFASSNFIYSVQERYSGGGCFYGVVPLDTKQSIIVFLKKLPNGTYGRSLSNWVYYTFPTIDSTVPVYSEVPISATPNASQPTPTPQYQEHEADSTTFPQLITTAVGQPPHPPQLNTVYPLPTSLYIRTVKGTEYELSVDFSPPKRLDTRLADENGSIRRTGCVTVNCIASSPNGVDGARVMPDGTIQIIMFFGTHISGMAFEFSTTSDALAVWDTNTLSVYSLPYRRLGFCCQDLNLINRITLTNTLKNMTRVAWSPDGRLIAYNDITGLYLWDALTSDSQPRLIALPFDAGIQPRFFSTTGRYLAVQRNTSRFYLDTVSGTEIPDGVISPDDRYLLQFDTQHPSQMQSYNLVPYHLNENRSRQNTRQVQWIDRNHYLVVDCISSDIKDCTVWHLGFPPEGQQFEGFGFAYDKITSTLAIAISGKRIGIVHQNRNSELQSYDFSNYLDSEIQAVHWMQPIFFQPGL